jgi:hypothetical protein
MMSKNVIIKFRIEKDKKVHWKKICSEKRITLSSLIIDSVENRILKDERRKILAFIEKQDNIFAKIENNINQVAKFVNAQKMINEKGISDFNEMLFEIVELKKEQNIIFEQIYSRIGNDY